MTDQDKKVRDFIIKTAIKVAVAVGVILTIFLIIVL